MRTAIENTRAPAWKQLVSPSGGMRVLLVLLAVPAVAIGALAGLLVLAAALPLLILGVGRPRPALRWHGPSAAGRRALVAMFQSPAVKPAQRHYG